MSEEMVSGVDYDRFAKRLREEVGRKAGESKARLFNTPITANTDILSEDITPTYAPAIFRIYVCFSQDGVLTIKRTYQGNTVTEYVNSGVPLTSNSPYTFDIIVDEGESINLRYSVDATVLKLSIVEIGVML